MWGKKCIPHRNRQRKTLQSQKATAHNCSLVVPPKPPHPHKERKSVFLPIRKGIGRQSNRAFLIAAYRTACGICLNQTATQTRRRYKKAVASKARKKMMSKGTSAFIYTKNNLQLILALILHALVSVSMQRLRHQTQFFHVIHKRHPHRLALACPQTRRQHGKYLSLLLAKHNSNYTLSRHTFLFSHFLVNDPTGWSPVTHRVAQPVVQFAFSLSLLINWLSDM